MRTFRLLPFFLLWPAVSLPAQTTTDILRGRVFGPDGAPIATARLTATSLETAVSRSTLTDVNGRYTIVFPDGGGRYRLRASYLGMADAEQLVEREADEEVLLANFRLELAPFLLDPLEVRVERGAPGRGEAGSRGALLPAEIVSRLPLEDYDPATLASLVPGVVSGLTGDSLDERAAFSVAGQRAALNQVTLDGGSFGSPLTGGQAGGGSPVGLPQEGIRNTQVVTSTYDVARGQFAGGQVAMTTRAGTNRLDGSFSYLLRDDDLQGRAGLSPFASNYTQHRLSGGVGGPLVRDRLFFNGSLALQRRSDRLFALTGGDPLLHQQLGASSDSIARFLDILSRNYGIDGGNQVGPFTRTGDGITLLARADYHTAERHSFMLRGHMSLFDQGNARIGPLELRQNGGQIESEGGGAMLSLSSRFGGSWVNELKVSLNRDQRDQLPYDRVPEGRVRVGSELSGGGRSVTTLIFGGDRGFPVITEERTVEVSNELSWLLGDAHRVKLGGVANRSRFEQQVTTNQLGTFTFNSLADFEAGRAASFSRALAPRENHGGGLNAALYLGDSWRPAPGLQLTFGARFEASRFDEQPVLNPAIDSLFSRRTDELPAELHVSPRVGFSYRLSAAAPGRGARVLRGGIGEFRGRAPFSLYAAALANTGLQDASAQLLCVGPAVPTPDWQSYAQSVANIPTTCVDTGAPSASSGRRPSVTVFAPDFGAPRSWRASLGLQSPLVSTLFGSLDLMRSWGVGLYGVRDLNLRSAPVFALARERARPVYADPRAIVPGSGEVSLLGSRAEPQLGQVFELRSDLSSRTSQATLAVNGLLPPRILVRASYTYSRSEDQSSFSCCAAAQGFAAPTTAGDPHRVEWATSDYERRHALLALVGIPFSRFGEISLIGRANSGARFTPMVGGDINGDGARNDRAFIFDPAATTDTAIANGMTRLLATAPENVRNCLRRQLGQIAARNSCRSEWTATFDARATLRPSLPATGRRLSLSVDVLNLAAGLDQLLHGADGLHGWGQSSFGGREEPLLYPRGFNPAEQGFRYQVNELFGQARRRRAGAAPFQVQLSARIAVGASGGAAGGLGPIALGGPGGGGVVPAGPGGGPGTAGGQALRIMRDGGGGIDPQMLLDRLLPNPVQVIIGLRDSLHLSEAQVQQLRVIADSLEALHATLRKDAQEKLGSAAAASDLQQALQGLAPVLRAGRRNVQQALERAQAMLTPEQWRSVPESIRRPFAPIRARP